MIIEQLRQGDEQAFRFIYKQHYALLCRFAGQLLGDIALAEEVVDDVIFYLWEHRTEVEFTHSIRAYLMQSVRNKCMNEFKSASHQKQLLTSSFFSTENIDFLDRLFSDEKHPLGNLLQQELEDEICRSIEALPLECKQVFKKSRFEQKKYEEIATELNISVNTVKYHIKNALSNIQQRMDKYLKLFILYIFMGN